MVPPTSRFLGRALGHELQSYQRVGVRHYLASIDSGVDWSCDYPAGEDSSVTEEGERNTKGARFKYKGVTRIGATATAEILEEAKRRGYQ